MKWKMLSRKSPSDIFRMIHVLTWPRSPCLRLWHGAWASLTLFSELCRQFWCTVKVGYHICCIVLIFTRPAISAYEHIRPFPLFLGRFLLSSELLFTASISTFNRLKSSAMKIVQWSHEFKLHKQFGGEMMSFWNKLWEPPQVALYTEQRTTATVFFFFLDLFKLIYSLSPLSVFLQEESKSIDSVNTNWVTTTFKASCWGLWLRDRCLLRFPEGDSQIALRWEGLVLRNDRHCSHIEFYFRYVPSKGPVVGDTQVSLLHGPEFQRETQLDWAGASQIPHHRVDCDHRARFSLRPGNLLKPNSIAETSPSGHVARGPAHWGFRHTSVASTVSHEAQLTSNTPRASYLEPWVPSS